MLKVEAPGPFAEAARQPPLKSCDFANPVWERAGTSSQWTGVYPIEIFGWWTESIASGERGLKM
jgi:hypothetical protein